MNILVIRLSSLGDILLATAFLETLPDTAQVDWVISQAFEFALSGHPKIRRLYVFDKKLGLMGWLKLMTEISHQSYFARVDLHASIRSYLGFFWLRLLDLKNNSRAKHFRVSKERLRTWAVFVLKSRVPAWFLPTPYWKRFAELAVRLYPQQNLGHPSYLPVLKASALGDEILIERGLVPGSYFALMPAASRATKEWSAEKFLALVTGSKLAKLLPVLVGRESDPACLRVRSLLIEKAHPFVDALAEPHFKITALILKNARFYLGCDTGLAHLSEALGTPSFVVYGPTRPSLGFGPWRPESKPLYQDIGCSPCSKDGKICYRFQSPYACLKELKVKEIEKRFEC